MGLLYNRVWKEEKEKRSGNFVLISRLDLQRKIVSSIEEQRFRCAVETEICSSYEVIYLFWRMRATIDHPSTDSFVKKKLHKIGYFPFKIIILLTNALSKSITTILPGYPLPQATKFLDTIYSTHGSAITCHPRFDISNKSNRDPNPISAR